MSKQMYSLSLEKKDWLLITSLWMLMSIILFIYPISFYFWYFGALGTLISAICIFYVIIVTAKANKKYMECESQNSMFSWAFIMNLLIGTFVTFLFGFIQIDNILFSLVLLRSIYAIIIIWLILKLLIGFYIIFVAIHSIRIFYNYLNFSKNRTNSEL